MRRVMVNTWSGWRRRHWLAEHPTGAMPDSPAPGDLAAEVAVRRAITRRRAREAVGVLAAVAVLVLAGVTAAAGVFRAAPGPAWHRPAAGTVYAAYLGASVKPAKLTPGAIIPIRTATNTAGKPIPVGGAVTIGLPPGGKTLYAAALTGNSLLGRAKIVPISVATNAPGTPIRIPIRVGLPLGVITPRPPRPRQFPQRGRRLADPPQDPVPPPAAQQQLPSELPWALLVPAVDAPAGIAEQAITEAITPAMPAMPSPGHARSHQSA